MDSNRGLGTKARQGNCESLSLARFLGFPEGRLSSGWGVPGVPLSPLGRFLRFPERGNASLHGAELPARPFVDSLAFPSNVGPLSDGGDQWMREVLQKFRRRLQVVTLLTR